MCSLVFIIQLSSICIDQLQVIKYTKTLHRLPRYFRWRYRRLLIWQAMLPVIMMQSEWQLICFRTCWRKIIDLSFVDSSKVKMVLANERRRYIYNVFSHWLKPFPRYPDMLLAPVRKSERTLPVKRHPTTQYATPPRGHTRHRGNGYSVLGHWQESVFLCLSNVHLSPGISVMPPRLSCLPVTVYFRSCYLPTTGTIDSTKRRYYLEQMPRTTQENFRENG